MVNGKEVRRQNTLSEGDEIVYGKEHTTKFSQKDKPSTRYAVVDADKVQPSHMGGQRNPGFFIDEAQPKDRKDQVSRSREAEIASEINPEEITFGATAYQGAPTINGRGEVIQGNNRAAALKEMFSGGYGISVKRYKSFLRDNAKMFGLTPEDIDRMKNPMLVNVATVDDAEAIRLGQLKASDNESGGVQQIESKSTVQKLTGAGKLQNFTDILLESDNPDVSISELIQENGVRALKYMRDMGIINDTQYSSAFNEKDALTEQARTDLRNIIKHTLFDGAPSEIETMFERMPAKAQRAILATISRDYKSDDGARIKGIIQKSISAFYNAETTSRDFSNAKNPKQAKAAMDSYERQVQLIGDKTMLPEEYFGKFALLLAEAYKGLSQRSLQDMFNRLYDSLQGVTSGTGDLFGGDAEVKKLSIEQAFKKVFGYEDTKLSGSNVLGDLAANGERRQSGSERNDRGGGRGASGERRANGGAGTESSTGEGKRNVAFEKKNSASNNTTDTVETASADKTDETPQADNDAEPRQEAATNENGDEGAAPVNEESASGSAPATEANSGGGGSKVPPAKPAVPTPPEEEPHKPSGESKPSAPASETIVEKPTGALPEGASVDDIKARIDEVKERRAEATKEYLSGQPHSEQAREEIEDNVVVNKMSVKHISVV